MRYRLSPDGRILHHPGGDPCDAPSVDADDVLVPHLSPRAMTLTLPGGEGANVLVRYSCHCWTGRERGVPGPGPAIMDGIRARILDMDRLRESPGLPDLIRSLDRLRVGVMSTERNYGAYDGRDVRDGLAYMVFFSIRRQKGHGPGEVARHARRGLAPTAGSAYRKPPTERVAGTSPAAALPGGLRGRTVRYRR